MKKLIVLSSVMLISLGILYAGSMYPRVVDSVVTVSTDGVKGSNINNNRLSYYVYNSSTCLVYQSTQPITASNYATLGCIPIYDDWQEDFNVYKGSWYYCIGGASGSAQIYIREKK